MVQLNASTLPSVKMARGVAPKTERVIQFGEGGFLRAFCDWMIDMANEKAGMDAGVVIVQPIERGMVSMLNEQDGLYTLILRGQVDGKPSKDERIIQSVKRGLSPYEDFEGYLALAHNPDMRIIISNTTEAGIVYTGKDSFDDKPQASYPGNKAGGITTLEDKSLGCTQKGGTAEVRDVLRYCEPVTEKGLNLVQGPGNDLCAITALMAAGAQMVLFTTGRGTPVGAPIPTVKVSTNTPLAEKKRDWIDFNAGILAQGADMQETTEVFFKKLLAIASGERTQSETHDYREIAIFKDGVTL